MKASAPRDLLDLFRQALNTGDVELLISLYEPDGVVAADPTRVVAGRAAIKSSTIEFLAQHPRFVLQESEVIEVGDLALVRSRWVLTMADASGVSRETNIAATLVVRRQAEGYWLVVIDRPVLDASVSSA